MTDVSSIFDSDCERDRLYGQSRLLKEYEQPVYDLLLADRQRADILDIGCNNGRKTADRFAKYHAGNVIGIEFHEMPVAEAKKRHADEVFRFFQMDIEAGDFEDRINGIMDQHGIEGFDIINMSFLLSHLKNPPAVLKKLRKILDKDGKLVIVEAEDSLIEMAPDADGLIGLFLEALRADVFSGDREIGRKGPRLLKEAGYRGVAAQEIRICASDEERQKRELMFQTFFSYLPEDFKILCRQGSDYNGFEEMGRNIAENFEKFKTAFVDEAVRASCGIDIITCGK